VDTTNTVDSKPIYYLVSEADAIIDAETNAGLVYLIDCNNITIKDLALTKNVIGVLLRNTTNSRIENATDSDTQWGGIYLYHYCNNNTLVGNTVSNCGVGICLRCGCSNNTISSNDVSNNQWVGIYLGNCSSNNVLVGNNASNSRGNGVSLYYYSNDNVLVGNDVSNAEVGVLFYYYSSNNMLVGNIASDTSIGFYLYYYCSNNTLVGNIASNSYYGILFGYSGNNTLFHNNFIKNTRQVYDFSWDNPSVSPSINIWDNGYPSGGNYWSNYTSIDVKSGPDQDQPGSDGIGDTPYIIDANNRDRYPLMNPYGAPPPPSYTLTIVATADGTTNPAPGTYTYTNGTEVSVTAIPDVGFSFGQWLLDGNVRTENPIKVMMDANHTLQAFFVDDIPPEIGTPTQDPTPDNVQPYQTVTVRINVTDFGTGVHNVTLWYSLNNGTTWTPTNMTEISENIYQATIPGYENCTWVSYKIVAYNNAGNNATKDNFAFYYKYHVIPEFPSAATMSLFMFFIMLAVVFTKGRLPRKPRN
jgi:parallel beta-helix repeat protein